MDAKRNVFISYGRKDVYPKDATNAVEQEKHFSIVEKVYNHLHKLTDLLNLEPWFDKRCLTHDRVFTDSINQAIEQSEYMLLFIGAHAIQSEWCEREWKHALKHCVPIIPILLEGNWGDESIQNAYPSRILSTDGINPQSATSVWDEDYLLKHIVSAVGVKPAPLTIPSNVDKLPHHYIERPRYLEALKQQLEVNDRSYAGRANIVGITSEQEVAALQGIGGIGKTTLAQALCSDCDVRRNFHHIFWLRVGPSFNVKDIPTLMYTVGVHFGDAADLYKNVQMSRARLQYHLQGKRTLLVLDDVWVEGIVDEFSLASVDIRLLVTTRNKALVSNSQRVDKLNDKEGLRLLATLFDPHNPNIHALNDDHRAIVIELDGHTLAVEIAGRWLKKYGRSPDFYLTRLRSNESELFKNLKLSETDRNSNLELSLSLSYKDLAPDDQRRFRALGVFASGSAFPLVALDTVWKLNDAFVEAQTLVDAGLLEQLNERYSLHPLLRAYARALLVRADEFDDVFSRYADFYITRAKQFDELSPQDWTKLEDYLFDITHVGDELVERTKIGKSGDLQRALIFAYNTRRYLNRRREVRRIEWTEMGLNAARALQATEDDDPLYRRRESIFLYELALAWNALGKKHEALTYLEQALPLERAFGDKNSEASTLTSLGMVWGQLGEKDKALAYYEQALPIHRAVENKSGESTTLSNIAHVWYMLGEKRKALDYLEQALPLARAFGDKSGEASTLTGVGMIWGELGEYRKALDYYEQALPLSRDTGDKSAEAVTLNNIGRVWSKLGEKRKALEYYERVVRIFKETGEVSFEAGTYANLSQIHRQLGQLDIAITYLRQTITILRHYNLPYDAGGVSVEHYEADLQQWEVERDNNA